MTSTCPLWKPLHLADSKEMKGLTVYTNSTLSLKSRASNCAVLSSIYPTYSKLFQLSMFDILKSLIFICSPSEKRETGGRLETEVSRKRDGSLTFARVKDEDNVVYSLPE